MECKNNDATRRNARRWLEDVIADLRTMGISGWMQKTRNRDQWRRIVEEAKAHPGLQRKKKKKEEKKKEEKKKQKKEKEKKKEEEEKKKKKKKNLLNPADFTADVTNDFA